MQDLRAIEVSKHQTELSKAKDDLYNQRLMFEQCKQYLILSEEHAIYLKYTVTL